MGHAIRIQNREQYVAAIRVLDKLPGAWRGVGPASAPVLLVLDSHYKALVEAGVVPANAKEGPRREKKAPSRKAKP